MYNDNLYQIESFLINFRYFSKIMHQKFNAYLKKNDVDCSEFICLLLLNREKDGLSMAELTKMSKVDKSMTTKIIKKLEEKDYIYRNRNNPNIRNYKILLHGKENHAMNNLSDLQILAIKRIYDSVLDYLGEFLKSNGFNDYWFDLEEEPKYREGIICDMAIEKVEKVILVLKKEYIFLKESELYSNLENFIYNDLYDIFDGKISYGYRFEAPVYGNLTTYEEYCKTLDKFNDIICRYI